MSKLTILVDMDAIVADMLTSWLDIYNQEWDDCVTVADIKTFHVENHVKEESRGHCFQIILRPTFYTNVKLIDGAWDAISDWKDSGHKVVFLSSPPGAIGAKEKYEWVDQHFGNLGIGRKDVILGSQKELVRGDILIDDYPKNAKAWRAAWPDGKTVTTGYPYNYGHSADYDLIAMDYTAPRTAWARIENFVATVAGNPGNE